MAASLNPAPSKDQRSAVQLIRKLCYDQEMLLRTLHRTLLLFVLAAGLHTPVLAQSGGNQLAGELNALRQQQRQVERNIGQFETSIKLLRANQPDDGTESQALITLEEQLSSSRKMLIDLTEQETRLLTRLMPTASKPAASTPLEYDDPEAEEVARLKSLLTDYYAAEARAEAAALSGQEANDLATTQEATAYRIEKVRLSGNEGISAIQQISARLADDSLPTQRREIDIIFHIEVRREGKLVSSSSHSLKTLGKSQYVSKVSLRGGDAKITVRKDSWSAELDAEDAADYLVTLNLPRGAEPELHVIPVSDLKATQWSELPPWLPYIGTIPTPPASS